MLRDQKRGKLLQYAERVWHITEGGEDARIDEAIARTEAFFRSLGQKTRLAEAGADIETRKRILGHTEDITARRYDHDEHLAETRRALEAAAGA